MTRKNRNILVLESAWDEYPTQPKLSIKSLVDFSVTNNESKYSYNFINTKEEFKYILENIKPNDYRMLYLAVHGEPSAIYIGANKEFSISLDEFAEIIGKRYKNYWIHFASCAVVNINKSEIQKFKKSTEVKTISGYTKYVDFDDSSIMDLVLLTSWIYYKNRANMMKRIERLYKSLISENGFKYF